MTLKFRLVRSLLRLYPSIWRNEYGEEIEELLLMEPLSASVIGDVLLNAARQHLRGDEPWKISGLFLLTWSLFWTAWNSIAPLSPPSHSLFTRAEGCIDWLIYFATGYWTVARGGNGVWRGASAAVRAALVGIMPNLTVLTLNALGILPQILIDINGRPHPHGHGIALLHIRGPVDGVLGGIQWALVLIPFLMAVVAQPLGLCGALLGRTVLKLRARS
jgi:hypothetical protein